MNSDTFIEVADDCPAVHAEVPPARGDRPTKAAIEYELIAGEPYALTEEDVAFRTRVVMRDIPEADWPAERERFLSQEKPRLRVSALAKRYGWGIHIDSHGRLALVAVESAEYQRLAADPALRHVRAFRTQARRAGGADATLIPLFEAPQRLRGCRVERAAKQRQQEHRRRRHVADLLRAEGVDRRRRGKNRRAREEGGELSPAAEP